MNDEIRPINDILLPADLDDILDKYGDILQSYQNTYFKNPFIVPLKILLNSLILSHFLLTKKYFSKSSLPTSNSNAISLY